jgi:hypothetical protein
MLLIMWVVFYGDNRHTPFMTASRRAIATGWMDWMDES